MDQLSFKLSSNPKEILSELLQRLNLREREVLQRRHALNTPDKFLGKRETLECIGKDFGVTRERIRQIENAAVKKLAQLPEMEDAIKEVGTSVSNAISYYGGIVSDNYLKDLLWEDAPSYADHASFIFMLDNLFPCFKRIENDHIKTSWANENHDINNTIDVIKNIIDIIESHSEPLEQKELVLKFFDKAHDSNSDNVLHDLAVESHLRLSKKIKQDVFGNWGLAHWRIVSPKRMNDKIYLVLKKHNKPMHFTEIAQAIDSMNFDSKKAHPPTIHNELILDKDRFVLVGRGIYALTEQGYKHGVVADVIHDILKQNGAMTKEEIVEAVLAQRIVAESTIYLALTSKNRFNKISEGRYTVD